MQVSEIRALDWDFALLLEQRVLKMADAEMEHWTKVLVELGKVIVQSNVGRVL